MMLNINMDYYIVTCELLNLFALDIYQILKALV
jgi:hypothetical protein